MGGVVVEAARRLGPRVRGLVWVDVYRSLDESGSDAGSEEEIAAFMAPFRADFGAATRASVRRIAALTRTRTRRWGHQERRTRGLRGSQGPASIRPCMAVSGHFAPSW
jgi:hypothetical protein